MGNTGKGTMQTGTALVLCCACLGMGFAMGSLFAAKSPVHVPQKQITESVQPAGSGQTEISREIAQLQAAALAAPKNADAWIRLGNACYDSGDPDGAVDAYRRALELQPANADVRTDLGTMYRAKGQYRQALQCYEAALESVPGHKNAVFNKGIVLLIDLGQAKDAVAFWKGVLAGDAGFTFSNGRLLAQAIPELCADAAAELEQRGNAGQALIACEEALGMDENFLPALLRKAWLLEKTGRASDARPFWKKALEIKADALDPAGVPVRSHIAEQD